LGGVVVAGLQDPLRTQTQLVDPMGVALELVETLAVHGVPNVDNGVVAAGDQQVAAGPDDAADHLQVA